MPSSEYCDKDGITDVYVKVFLGIGDLIAITLLVYVAKIIYRNLDRKDFFKDFGIIMNFIILLSIIGELIYCLEYILDLDYFVHLGTLYPTAFTLQLAFILAYKKWSDILLMNQRSRLASAISKYLWILMIFLGGSLTILLDALLIFDNSEICSEQGNDLYNIGEAVYFALMVVNSFIFSIICWRIMLNKTDDSNIIDPEQQQVEKRIKILTILTIFGILYRSIIDLLGCFGVANWDNIQSDNEIVKCLGGLYQLVFITINFFIPCYVVLYNFSPTKAQKSSKIILSILDEKLVNDNTL